MTPPGISSSFEAVSIETCLAELEDGRKIHQGWSPQCDKSAAADNEWGVLKTTSIQAGRFGPEHNKRLPAKLSPRPHLEVRAGDILLTCAGPRHRCGVSCLVRRTRARVMISGKMYRFRANPERIRPEYLEAFLQSETARQAIDRMKTGISDSGLNLTHDRFRQLVIPLVPIDEQQRIIAQIEKQFTRLDAGVASLKGMQIALKRYRASVLNAACEGRLVPTEAELARKENRSYETGEQLLQRIFKERREKWNSKAKYKEPATPSTSELPRVPQGWTWANVGQLFHLDSGEAFKKRDYSTDGLKLFQIANVGFGKSLWKQRNFLPDSFREKYPELILRGGDIVIALNRPIIDQKLKIAQLTEQDLPAILYQRVGRLAAVSSEVGRYFFYVAQSEFILKHVRARLQGTDQPYLNTSLVPTIPVPLPPFAEQARIVAEVERRLSVIEKLQAMAATSFQRVTHLRQSILERAFSGWL